MATLQEMAAKALTRGVEYPVVEFEKRWYNWGEFRLVADQLDRLIDEMGIGPRASVACLPSNTPGMLAALVGLLRRGQSIRMVNVYQGPAGIASDIVRLKPAVVVGNIDDFSQAVLAVMKEQGIAGVGLSGMDASVIKGCEHSGIDSHSTTVPQIDLLTSGTTGPPKQFSLTYDLIARDMVGVNTMKTETDLDPRNLPPVYFYLSFSNISGIYLIIPTILSGMRGILVGRFTIDSWWDYVRRFRPVHVGIPLPAIQMIMEADIPPEDLSSLKAVNTGAALLDPELHRAFEERYGIAVLLVYGATETGGPVAMMSYDLYKEWGRKKFGSLGRAFNQAKLRVVHPDTGELLPAGKEGLLEIQTDRIGPDWIRTNDLCVIDSDDFLYFRGRADGAINRGGFKIIPEVVESALKKHEAIVDASVVGVSDKRLGEVPAAAIQFRKGVEKPSFEELKSFLREQVAATHIPAQWREVEQMPYTNTMKVHRGTIKKLFEESNATRSASCN